MAATKKYGIEYETTMFDAEDGTLVFQTNYRALAWLYNAFVLTGDGDIVDLRDRNPAPVPGVREAMDRSRHSAEKPEPKARSGVHPTIKSSVKEKSRSMSGSSNDSAPLFADPYASFGLDNHSRAALQRQSGDTVDHGGGAFGGAGASGHWTPPACESAHTSDHSHSCSSSDSSSSSCDSGGSCGGGD